MQAALTTDWTLVPWSPDLNQSVKAAAEVAIGMVPDQLLSELPNLKLYQVPLPYPSPPFWNGLVFCWCRRYVVGPLSHSLAPRNRHGHRLSSYCDCVAPLGI